jgi:hypothetical protein
MIDPEHDLPISRQAKVLEIIRSTVYYEPRLVSPPDLWLMRQIDELHLNYLFFGSRMLRDMLSHQGIEVGRRHIRTLMRKMGIDAIYRRPNTSRSAPGHRIYPYLVARPGHHSAQSGLGHGHHLHPYGARLRLSGRCRGLVQPPRALVAAVDHHGGELLHRGAR